MVGKWPQLLRELAPRLERIAFIYNPTTIPSGFLQSLETVDPSMSVQIVQIPIHDAAEIDAAIAALGRESGTGLVVLPDIFLVTNRAQVIASASKYGLPTIYPASLWTKNDGLISYGPDTPDLFYRAASYVDRILKGEIQLIFGSGSDQVRTDCQPQNRQGARHHSAAHGAWPRRGGDRITAICSGV